MKDRKRDITAIAIYTVGLLMILGTLVFAMNHAIEIFAALLFMGTGLMFVGFGISLDSGVVFEPAEEDQLLLEAEQEVEEFLEG